jgi:hypothetical protein
VGEIERFVGKGQVKRVWARNRAEVRTRSGWWKRCRTRCRKQCRVLFQDIVRIVDEGGFSDTNVSDINVGVSSSSF